MRRALWTSAAIFVVALAAAAMAHGEEPTRESFVAQAEPICAQNVEVSKRVLNGVQKRINNDRLRRAGGQFHRASETLGRAIKKIVALPRPAADNQRLLKWFKFLRIVKKRLGDVGRALKEGNKIKARHESIRAEDSGNAANNVSFVFGFDSCRLSRSQFR